jgi:hypothetical protein
MMVPRKTMEKELKTQEKELTDDITNLNKKVKVLSSFAGLSLTSCDPPGKVS